MSASAESTDDGNARPVSAGPAANSEPYEDGLTQETAFEMLSNQRRRQILHYLFQQEEPVSVRELSAQLAAWENEIATEEVSYQQRRRVYTALRQVHLPKLGNAGIIDYDPRQARAKLTEEASEIEVYLDVVPHNEIPWSTYYLGLGVLSCGLLAGVAANLFPLHLLPDLGWAFLVALFFTVSALVNRYREQQMRLGTGGKPPLNR